MEILYLIIGFLLGIIGTVGYAVYASSLTKKEREEIERAGFKSKDSEK